MANKKIILIIILVIVLIGVFLFLNRKENQNNFYPDSNQEGEQDNSAGSQSKEIKFTHKIFDPELVSHIIPLGELNGGYEETQTINGVTINIKMDAARNAPEISVYAPTDMTLEDYSYFAFSGESPNWHLGFRISRDMKLNFDHITWVSDEMKAVMPPTPNSAYVSPKKKLSFKAGELIAKTSGTDQAHNWNIYLRDNRHTNTFVNQARFEKLQDRYDFLNAVCPFDYYEDSVKQEFVALMGATKAGQSKTCGTNSRDVKGSLAGLWHLTKDGFNADYQGLYASPFSIYKNSAEEIIIYEIDRQRFILGAKNPTYKDPATVTDAHCYTLTQYGDSRPEGYTYFKIISDKEMKMSYGKTGNCPTTFPENSATYYR